jgi:hypothetical protein
VLCGLGISVGPLCRNGRLFLLSAIVPWSGSQLPVVVVVLQL